MAKIGYALSSEQFGPKELVGIYTRPEQPVPIYVSGFGPQATELAGRIGDGYVQQVGPDMDGFFAAWGREVLPQLR
jgi:alkanesulfonate monooxygenase SsuD/methylene tetrahydromethanopterin reductase-like flavin-dependent oxidoreductase (luciferase family)